MRIRKRSIAALSLSCEKPEISCSSREEEQMIKEKQFILPLLAATMDVQASASAHAHFEEKERHAIAQFRSRPLHNWKNDLLRFTIESQESGESDKPCYRWDRNRSLLSCRKTEGGKIRKLTSEGGSEMKALNLGLSAAMKKQRSKSNCTKKCRAGEKRKKPAKMKGNEEGDEEKKLEAGNQCRRRNGRGWRCSERTLVGYYLCEHHLGKGRLKSINNSAASVVGNAKATKFKNLKLIHATAASSL